MFALDFVSYLCYNMEVDRSWFTDKKTADMFFARLDVLKTEEQKTKI